MNGWTFVRELRLTRTETMRARARAREVRRGFRGSRAGGRVERGRRGTRYRIIPD